MECFGCCYVKLFFTRRTDIGVSGSVCGEKILTWAGFKMFMTDTREFMKNLLNCCKLPRDIMTTTGNRQQLLSIQCIFNLQIADTQSKKIAITFCRFRFRKLIKELNYTCVRLNSLFSCSRTKNDTFMGSRKSEMKMNVERSLKSFMNCAFFSDLRPTLI